MATWDNAAFEQAAASLARAWHAGRDQKGASLGDLVEKTARDEGLNPEQIRRLARITNGFAFNAIFKAAGAEKAAERYPDFEVADADVVIARLHKEVEAPAAKTAAEYPALDDQFAPLRERPEDFAGSEKRAAAVGHLEGIQAALGPAQSPYARYVAAKHAADEAAVVRTRHLRAWDEGMLALRAKLAEVGFDRDGFEVVAASLHGTAVVPELNALRELAGRPALPSDPEVYAKLAQHEVHRETAATALLAKTAAARVAWTEWKEVAARAAAEAQRAEDVLYGRG